MENMEIETAGMWARKTGRSNSISSAPEETNRERSAAKKRKLIGDEMSIEIDRLEEVRQTRSELEEFLFNECNKINKLAMNTH